MNLNHRFFEVLEGLMLRHVPTFLFAVLTLFVGLFVIKIVVSGFRKFLESREIDVSLSLFVVSLLRTLLRIVLVLSVAGMIGIEMTSFVAILGAFSLAVGMALSGTLQNFAGGVIILLLRPFKVGDFIEAAGFSGTVMAIQIFSTIMKTGDNKTIVIPNAQLSNTAMINYSTEAQRRVDFSFGIGYGDDIDLAKSVLMEIVGEDSRILKSPEPFVAVGELADSSVNLVLRVWVASADYWGVLFGVTEMVKKTFDEKGISFPFPQQDVHMHS